MPCNEFTANLANQVYRISDKPLILQYGIIWTLNISKDHISSYFVRGTQVILIRDFRQLNKIKNFRSRWI